MLLHMLRHARQPRSSENQDEKLASTKVLPLSKKRQTIRESSVEEMIEDSFRSVGELYDNFKLDARAQVRRRV